MEDQQVMIQWVNRYLGCAWCSHVLCCVLCSSSCKSVHPHDRSWEGYCSAGLTLSSGGMGVTAGMLKLLGVVLCNLWDHSVSKITFVVFRPGAQTEQCWFLRQQIVSFLCWVLPNFIAVATWDVRRNIWSIVTIADQPFLWEVYGEGKLLHHTEKIDMQKMTARKLFWSLWQSVKLTHWGGTKKILTRVRWTFSTKLVVRDSDLSQPQCSLEA